MLTSDLVRVRRRGGAIEPRFLDPKARARMLPIAAQLIERIAESQGKAREELEAALGAVDHEPRDRLVVLGLRKLLLDRTELVTPPGLDPVVVRDTVFRLAASVRRDLGPRDSFDREVIVARAAVELGVEPAVIEARMFGDLRKNEIVERFEPVAPEELLDRYDLALAQGVLLRAIRVRVSLAGEEPARVRQLFRAARFHGLLYRVRRDDDGYAIELDGPLSLFSAVQRYGLGLALFLPEVLRCSRWSLSADVLWGKERAEATLTLSPDDRLRPSRIAPVTGRAPGIDKLVEDFRALESPWSVRQNDEIIALPGEVAIVPDLLFENAETGERVYLEAFGYWSRTAVWQRIETIRRAGFPGRILLAIGKQLRVSEELLEESDAGELYVYRGTMRARAILQRLDATA